MVWPRTVVRYFSISREGEQRLISAWNPLVWEWEKAEMELQDAVYGWLPPATCVSRLPTSLGGEGRLISGCPQGVASSSLPIEFRCTRPAQSRTRQRSSSSGSRWISWRWNCWMLSFMRGLHRRGNQPHKLDRHSARRRRRRRRRCLSCLG